MAARTRVHLFDGHVYIFRAYYSLPPMKTPDGTPCNAAYGFANTLIKYMADPAVTHAAVCFDYAMESFRNDVFPEYKAQRGEPPDDLEPQFDICSEVARALGFAVYEEEGWEADDLIGTLADHVVARRGDAVVVTSDKDLCQLVREDGRVVVYDLGKETFYDADGVREKFRVSPIQIPDYLSLVGDTIDNLPGVPGIGAKGAAAVLGAFGRVEDVPAEPDAWAGVEIRGAKRLAEKIDEHRETALQTKDLATVRRDVPGIAPPIADLAWKGALRDEVEPLFARLGWKRILTRIPRFAR